MIVGSIMYFSGVFVLVEDYISKKDRIISTAIDIICDSGLSALTTRNIALKENMSEALLYKYYGSVDEVLKDVVDYYFTFDKGIQATVSSKDSGYIDKVRAYVDSYAIYYDNYYALSVIMLQYEELLHNPVTRDKVAESTLDRKRFLKSLFEGAINNKEIKDTIPAEELSVLVTGIIYQQTLSRRYVFKKETFQAEINAMVDKLIKVILID